MTVLYFLLTALAAVFFVLAAVQHTLRWHFWLALGLAAIAAYYAVQWLGRLV